MNAGRRKDSCFLTPTEIIEKYPQLTNNFNWDARTLGIFLRTKLIRGKYNSNERKAMIEEESLFLLIEYVNELIDSQKVNLR